MRSLLFTIALSVLSICSFCQVRSDESNGNMALLTIGVSQTSISNPGFDAWTMANYDKKQYNGVGVNFDLTVVLKKYDAGTSANVSSRYTVADLYFGRRLNSRKDIITSYLNFKIGEFAAFYNDIVPANYIAPTGSQGKQLQLQYNNWYLAAESKNYLNFLSFKSGKGRKAVSWNTELFIDLGYEPWGGNWEYGYYTGSGKYAQFHGTRINGIPELNHVFFQAGISFGIGN